MTKLRRSPNGDDFHIKRYEEDLKKDPTDAHALEMLELFKSMAQKQIQIENDPKWAIDNLEYDLRTTDWIVQKVQNSEVYAQNLYAAMCNRDFQRNDVWPILKNNTWCCSWRRSGGIVADMRETGDYLDWYCSGIRNDGYQDDITTVISDQFVSEGYVTSEIQEDLLKLGWIVLDDDMEDL